MKNNPNRFGKLTVLRSYRVCQCDCGGRTVVRLDHLKSGRTISCGCERNRLASERMIARGPLYKHGASRTRAYTTWLAMRGRCSNPNNPAFHHYGGRGIKVCERWEASFDAFLEDMGQPDHGLTLDRTNNDGDYEPGNCRWVDRMTQMNNRRSNVLVTHDGKTQTIAQWAVETGIHRNTIEQRLHRKYPLERVFSPEKYKNTAGLAFGGKANGARLLARTHCKNGHLFDDDNTYFNGRQRVCRACRREAARAK
jgi:hypothetical protein